MSDHTHWSSCGSTLCPNGQLTSDSGTWRKCRAQNCQNGTQYGEFHSILSWVATLLGTPQSVVLQQDSSEFNSLCISPGHLGMGVLRTQGRHTWGTQLCMGELLLLCHSSVEPKTTALTQGPTWSQAGNTNVPSIQQKGMHLVCLYTSRNAVPFNPQIKEKKITLIPVTWMPVFWKGNIFWFTVTHNKVIRYWKGSLLTLLQKSCQKPQNQIWKHNVSLFTWQHFECCETLKDLAQFWPNNLCFHRIK